MCAMHVDAVWDYKPIVLPGVERRCSAFGSMLWTHFCFEPPKDLVSRHMLSSVLVACQRQFVLCSKLLFFAGPMALFAMAYHEMSKITTPLEITVRSPDLFPLTHAVLCYCPRRC